MMKINKYALNTMYAGLFAFLAGVGFSTVSTSLFDWFGLSITLFIFVSAISLPIGICWFLFSVNEDK